MYKEGLFVLFFFYLLVSISRLSCEKSMCGCDLALTPLGVAGWRPSAQQPELQQSWPNRAGSPYTAGPESCLW